MNLLLDNSALSLLSCKRRYQLVVSYGLKTTLNNKAIAFGSAFHTCIEHLDKGKDINEALIIAGKDRDINSLLLLQTITLFKTSVKLPPPILLNDNIPAVEIKFKFPYKSVITPTGQSIDIELCGTIDRIYLDEEKDILVILDYKTAGDVTEARIKAKVDSYSLAFQLPFYVYCLMKSGLLPANYQEYLTTGKYRTEIMFAFYNAPVPIFPRLIKQSFNDDFINREIPLIINNRINEAVNISLLGEQPAAHDGMNVYKACDNCFARPACLQMGTERETEYLSRFEREPYNPLMFR